MESWSFQTGGELLIVSRPSRSSKNVLGVPVEPYRAAFFLESLGDEGHRRLLVDLAARLHGGTLAVVSLSGEELRARLADDLRVGRLVAFEPHRPPPAKRLEKLEEYVAEDPLTWIEIELLDQDKNPVPEERYVIETGDATFRRGRLDRNGRAREEDLRPGDCKVMFPDLMPGMWKKL